MISNKFLCYQTTEEFLKEINSIADTSIAFVLDKGFLYTHGVIFFDPKIKEVILHALGYLEDRISENEKVLSTALNEYDQTIVEVLKGKVDKEKGKGLSSNDFSDTEKSKLSGIETGAQKNTVLSVAGKTGAVTLGKSDVGLGNVDNTSDLGKPISTATQTALNNKVDKVSGKGLSTNDYTTTEKNKLAGIETGAQVNKVTSVAGKTGAVIIEDKDIGYTGEISSKAIGSLESRIDMLEGAMGTALTELQLEIKKLKG